MLNNLNNKTEMTKPISHSNGLHFTKCQLLQFQHYKYSLNTGELIKTLRSAGIYKRTSTRRSKRGGRKVSTVTLPNQLSQRSHQSECPTPEAETQNNNQNSSLSTEWPSSHSLHIGLWNARSVETKVTSICDYILEYNIDVFTLTETWLKGDERDQITLNAIMCALPAYKILQVPREGRRGGGVAIIARNNLKLKSNQSKGFKSFEHMEVTLFSASLVRLFLIYRPPVSAKDQHTITDFMEEFATFLEYATLQSGNLILLGDFNIHVDCTSTHALKFNKILESVNLEQHVSEPTHVKGHTLDLVISRKGESHLGEMLVSPVLPSDHFVISFTLDMPKPCLERKEIVYRKWKSINFKDFCQDVETSALIVNPEKGLDALVDQYHSTLTSILDKHAPEVK